MSWDWKSVVKSIAPMLGTALGGPLGGVAGAALARALGGDPTKASAEDLSKMMGSLTAENILAIKKAEQAFTLQMRELDIKSESDLEAIAAGDRDSARNREIQVRDLTPAIGFYLITAGFFSLLVGLLFYPVPEANKAVIYTMTGSLGAAWLGCIAYFYGTTAGSRSKDVMLYNSTPSDPK
jgi:hypothetical protein